MSEYNNSERTNFAWITKYDQGFKKFEHVLDIKEIALESVAIFFLIAIPYFAYKNSLPY
jgi:hypothetical protein